MACRVEHHVEFPANWRIVKTEQLYVEWAPILSLSCLHCATPLCISVCPTNAISKREEDGIVVVEAEKCQGKDNCDRCVVACPYGIPQFGPEEKAKMQKCDFCLERLKEGKKPACVIHCPAYALDAGLLEELIAKYGAVKEAIGFKYSKQAKPSIIFKPIKG